MRRIENGNNWKLALKSISLILLFFLFWATPDYINAASVEKLGQYNGHYYYVFERGSMSYDYATEFCRVKGGYMASITSEEENAFVFSFVEQNGYDIALFGLTDVDSEENWIWQSGEPVSYVNWADGEPNGGSSENYGMFATRGDGTWNDGRFDVNAIVCEWDSLDKVDLDAEVPKYKPEIIEFGSYPQSEVKDNNILEYLKDKNGIVTYGSDKYANKNGQWFIYEPIQWLILQNSNGKALVMSQKILDACALNSYWEESDARKWLNSTFYENAFDEKEKECILPTGIKTENGSKIIPTQDRLFYPSSTDMTYFRYGFNDNNDRKAEETDYSNSYDTYILRDTWATFIEGYTHAVYGWSGSIVNMPIYANYGARPCMTIDIDGALQIAQNSIKSIDSDGISISLSKTSYTYDGKPKTPSVTVSFGDKKLSDSDYSVAYKDNIFAGTASVIVTGKGKYEGEKTATFTITPGKKIIVSFDGNGGTAKKKQIKVKIGGKYGSLPKATRKGYELKGWFTKKKGGKEVTKDTYVENKKKHTLYAQWKKATYTIEYELDGGTNAKKNPTSYTVNTKTFNLANPSRNGYVFKGWFKDSKKTKSISKVSKGSTGNLVLYAKWTPITYNIQFNGNGATSGSMAKMTGLKYDKEVTLKKNKFKRNGYDFGGWSTKKNGTIKYTDGQTLINMSSKQGKTIVLYAVWNQMYKAAGFEGDEVQGVRDILVSINNRASARANYSDDYFIQPSRYHNNLIKISALAAASTYGKANSTMEFLDKCGFTGGGAERIFTGNGSSSTSKNNDHCTIYTGSKMIKLGDNKKHRVIAVVVSGYSGDGYEWISNFNLGSGKKHAGFNAAANEVLQILKNKYGSYKDTVFWIMGHSRGGAISNIVAQSLSTSVPVHAYCFATPNVVDKSLANVASANIYNFINMGDFVPELPPNRTGWGYRKYGKLDVFDVNNQMRILFNDWTGMPYNGLSEGERKTLIDAFCIAGGSRQLFANKVIKGVTAGVTGFTAQDYCQKGLALAMNGNDNVKNSGIKYMAEASINIPTIMPLTAILVIDQCLNPKIEQAHTMEIYLAYAECLPD